MITMNGPNMLVLMYILMYYTPLTFHLCILPYCNVYLTRWHFGENIFYTYKALYSWKFLRAPIFKDFKLFCLTSKYYTHQKSRTDIAM